MAKKGKKEITPQELMGEIIADINECIRQHPGLSQAKGKQLDALMSHAQMFAFVGADVAIRNMHRMPRPGKGLRVIVLGPPGSGKSTFAKVIADALREKGFKPSIDDDELNWALMPARMKSLQGTAIPVITQNESRVRGGG